MRYLLSVGAKHNFGEAQGCTPLHWAASHGNVATIQALVEAGASVVARDGAGRTPLDVARPATNREYLLGIIAKGAHGEA